MCSEWDQAAGELEEWWRKGTRPEEGSGIEMPQLRSSGLPHLHSPYLAVCRSLSLFQSQKQTRLYEANHIVLGKTPIFSGERKGKRPIWSRDCMRGFAGPETVVAAFGVPWEDGKHVNVSPPRPPKIVPPPAERIIHHVAPDAVDVTVPRPVCPSQLSTNEGTEHSSGPPPLPRQSSATVLRDSRDSDLRSKKQASAF